MPNMKSQRGTAHGSGALWAAALSLSILGGSIAAFAQETLPLPTPGTNPAPAATPAPGGDNAARARAAALAAKANIDITEAWTRASGNATTAPVYFHIVSAKDADKLVGVEVSAADKAELRDEAGKPMPMPQIDVPPGGTLNFAPGSRYLNLVGLKAPLKEGDSFLVTFKFDKAGTSSTAVKVLGAGATAMPPATTARKGDTTAGVSQR